MEFSKLKEHEKNQKLKSEKNILVTIFKIVSVLIILGVEIAVLIFLYTTTKGIYMYAKVVFEIIKLFTVLYLIYRHDSSAYKISWIIFIMFMPVVGLLAFYLWGNSKLRKKVLVTYEKIREDSKKYLRSSEDINKKILNIDKYKYNEVNYINKISGYPTYKNDGIEYFDIGEKFFKELKIDLINAKKYILIKFFIISDGVLWKEFFEILKQKRKENVEIIITIDSLGCMFKLPKNFYKDLNTIGVKVYKFNPFSVIINSYINYRDHRKIIIIDGNVAYTGGVNLADEYANIIEKYGYWKDVGIKIKGEAVNSFVVMFLRSIQTMEKEKIDYMRYINNEISQKCENDETNGYIIPYEGGPDNRKNPIENIYIQTINYAKNYIYMTTPYFVVSESVLNAILNSARSGVDVRVIVPYIPDKKLVNVVTKSYYEVLLEAGVRVYEYTPGFIHSKTFVTDDETSIVGTANLDFRSMHLNFECAVFTYKTGEEVNIKNDFCNMLQKCDEIKLENWKKRSPLVKLIEAIMTAFSPML